MNICTLWIGKQPFQQTFLGVFTKAYGIPSQIQSKYWSSCTLKPLYGFCREPFPLTSGPRQSRVQVCSHMWPLLECTSCGCALPRPHFLPSTQDSRLPLESTFCRWVDVPKCACLHAREGHLGGVYILAVANRIFLGTLFRFVCEPTFPFVYILRRKSR